MATAIGYPRDPTSTAAGQAKYDLVIHISDIDTPDAASSMKQMCSWSEGVFPGLRTVIAYPAGRQVFEEDNGTDGSVHCHAVAYPPEAVSVGIPQVRSRQEYKSAFAFSELVEAKASILLGNAGDLLSPATLSGLAQPILADKLDLTVASYQMNPFEGLVNSAILYPLSRVISGSAVRYPLAPDIAFSSKAREFLMGRPLNDIGDQGQARILWPALELELAGFKVGQASVGHRTQAASSAVSLEDLINEVAGSLFTEIESKASLWQRKPLRSQVAMLSRMVSQESEPSAPDPQRLVESFKLAAGNLQEIWRVVLPPQSLLALKQVARLPTDRFEVPDSLWVRIVYDFLLAHRSRAMSRKHLLGALTPLYLGWLASYIIGIERIGYGKVEERIEALATAFETDRPYLVSQWRWPDRFNP